jgi:hypothetical protein
MLNRHLALVTLSLYFFCCGSATTEVRNALVDGRQEEVDRFVKEFAVGNRYVDPVALKDERAVATDVVMRIDGPNAAGQYRVALVSDFFLCLLQIKAGVESRDIVPMASRTECSRDGSCEVCNSLVYPLPDDLRNRLREYWHTHLRR